MAIPTWAIGVFIAVWGATAGLAIWGLKALGSRVSADIAEIKAAVANSGSKIESKMGELSKKVHTLENRIVALETLVAGHTPPYGISFRPPTPNPGNEDA